MSPGLEDTPYPTTYIRELSPAWLRYAAAWGGVATPDPTLPFRYLELGCGAGLSTLLHAAAFPHAQFHACDIDATAIGEAGQRVVELGLDNVHLHHADFDALCDASLPAMDFVVLHGVYGWVNDHDQLVIRRLLRERLRPGGVAYVSYNCLPGWCAELPLRRMFRELADTHAGTSAARAAAAAQDLAGLLTSPDAPYVHRYPTARTAIAAYLTDDPSYLAHELLSETWQPRYAVDVHEELRDAGLEYVASATLVDNHPPLILDEVSHEAIGTLPSTRLRTLAEDLLVSRQLRRDVFVRGGATPRSADVLADVPIGDAYEWRVGVRLRVPRGTLSFGTEFAEAVRRLLCGTCMPFGDAVQALSSVRSDAEAVARNLAYLIAGGALRPFAVPALPRQPLCGTFCSEPIETMLRTILSGRAPGWVASPALGGGVRVTPEQARRLQAWSGDRTILGDASETLERFAALGIIR